MQAEPRRKIESGHSGVAPKGVIPVSPPFFPVFLVSRFDSLLSLDGPTVVHLKATENTGHAWLSPATAYLNNLMVAYLTNARLDTVTRR